MKKSQAFAALFVLGLIHCAGSPPPAPTAEDLRNLVQGSREACQKLLETTAPAPPPPTNTGGTGGVVTVSVPAEAGDGGSR